ncbi:MAG: sigma-70 family RNA polymerase sigma factor [Clostridia bacterium]|nr:sigma-70 family RNA polymerase sigma factor [Clostridia bacterium]
MKKEEILKDYMGKNGLDIDELINAYYGYVYIIVKNSKGISISNEDMEEIISDTFFAIWKNSKRIGVNVPIKPYLIGIIRNVMNNKYREININDSISDYEDRIPDTMDFETIIQEKEQNEMIQKALKQMKQEEYNVFMMFYYEAKTIKEIAHKMQFSESKVKVMLHRIRKEIKKNLRNGGYGYGK